MERNYAAFILKDSDGYTVVFPDLPGCMSAASTFDEAYNNAREVLPAYLDTMRAENMNIPEPTPFENAVADPEDTDAVVGKLLVPAKMPGHMVRTNITIDSYLLEAIDRITTNRSAFFNELAEQEVRRRMTA
ncbi:type II toxin-antitoxin system HicB family antitoxin [Thalassospira sp. MCCC 1A03138]|uniref:type II toxin-antitoxin system HicB family antitoxin n=1 Tax=Thalassospira sp. MCCC 1A03138 TaxID=1470576 RepID=UPI000A1E05DE|nr:type II toxin-antitoxin system HicB family antitoxin [Thalassospira sp. MCCC 1A03138]OSQ30143.1 hypothetical protein TH468_11785 [Thalassospira sp. MCCC 1A03138]